VKKGKQVPANAIPCQEPDEITGHWPHWIKCERNNPADKWHFEGLKSLRTIMIMDYGTNERNIDYTGTYELCGEKINGNPEHIQGHILIKHGREYVHGLDNLTFDGIKEYLTNHDIEGIVFHHKIDGRMCKIRKSDFGIKR